MTKPDLSSRPLVLLLAAVLFASFATPQSPTPPAPPAPAAGVELPCHRIPNLPEAAEWYFSTDGTFLIGNAKGPGDAVHHV